MRKRYKEEPLETKAPIRQARFYCIPGIEPAGYKCGNIKIIRNLGESLEDLRKRCRDLVEWPDSQTQHTFLPL